MAKQLVKRYSSGMVVLPPSEFPIDYELLAIIKKKKSELEATGQLANSSTRSKRSRIKEISLEYANENEPTDQNDKLTLTERMHNAWDFICKYSLLEEGLSHSAIIGVARNLLYVNQEQTPNVYRQDELLTPPRELDNQDSLHGLMGCVIDNVDSIDDPLIKALYTQFEIYYFQPANNGNKRLGQMLAWKMMDEAAYPFHFVPPEEFQRYTRLMNSGAMAVDRKLDQVHLETAVKYMMERVSFSLDLVRESQQVRIETNQ